MAKRGRKAKKEKKLEKKPEKKEEKKDAKPEKKESKNEEAEIVEEAEEISAFIEEEIVEKKKSLAEISDNEIELESIATSFISNREDGEKKEENKPYFPIKGYDSQRAYSQKARRYNERKRNADFKEDNSDRNQLPFMRDEEDSSAFNMQDNYEPRNAPYETRDDRDEEENIFDNSSLSRKRKVF
jgi:hypothetical protein